MRQSVLRPSLLLALAALLWGGCSAVLRRRSELNATGELQRLPRARRDRALHRALVDAGLVSPRIVLLSERPVFRTILAPAVASLAATRREERRGQAQAILRTRDRARERASRRVPLTATLLALGAVALTLIPLVRPLAEASPWLAGAGMALALAALLSARRS